MNKPFDQDQQEFLSRHRVLRHGTERLMRWESIGSLPGSALLVYPLWHPNPWPIALGLGLSLLGLGANAARNIKTFGRMDEYERLNYLKAVAVAFIFLMMTVNIAGTILMFTGVRPVLIGLALIVSFLTAFVILGVAQARLTSQA